jgi:hypothetical protein
VTVLSQVVLSRTISEEEYADQLTRYQALLGRLAREAAAQERSILIVFEGWGAAGKGGCIKRLTEGLDPRGYIVYPMNPPRRVPEPPLPLSLLAAVARARPNRHLRSQLVQSCLGRPGRVPVH